MVAMWVMDQEQKDEKEQRSNTGNGVDRWTAEDERAERDARHEAAFAEVSQAMALQNGQLQESQITLRNAFSLVAGVTPKQEREKKKQAERMLQDIVLASLLEDMRQRLKELERRMAQLREGLTEKYGSDFVGGMASAYLSEDELRGLRSEDEKLRALANKFLDEHGHRKAPYKNLPEAQYVEDWNEAQKLRPIVAKYDGRSVLTAEEAKEVYSIAKDTSLSDSSNMVALSDNEEFRATIDSAINRNASSVSHQDQTAEFTFR